jgi:hypothetical protein
MAPNIQAQRNAVVFERIEALARADTTMAMEFAAEIDDLLEGFGKEGYLSSAQVAQIRGDAWGVDSPAELSAVLERLHAATCSSETLVVLVADSLDAALDFLQGIDVFGTEGQLDPRGDGRVAGWSMRCVQGVDTTRSEQAQESSLEGGFVVRPDGGEALEIFLNGQELGRFNHDEHGWSGMHDAVDLAQRSAGVLGLSFTDER